jgi:hypothetical protein
MLKQLPNPLIPSPIAKAYGLSAGRGREILFWAARGQTPSLALCFPLNPK